MVELAMAHAGARAHALHVAVTQHRAVAHAVLVFQGAAEDVGEDLHVLVAVRAEALAALHAVFVDDAQRAEAHVPRVAVFGEGKGVARTQPTVFGTAALLALANLLHGRLLMDSPKFSKVPRKGFESD
jgi:hypothetical protein